MRLAVFTHAEHFVQGSELFSYGPYVREMDLWFQHVKEVTIIAPVKPEKDSIDQAYRRQDISYISLRGLNFTNANYAFKSVLQLPLTLSRIFGLMREADHLHLRCPGNIGLLSCILQIFFPGKPKTVKYAGNWNSKSNQPWSYRLQKWIISNSFLSRNMKVLVYGDWPDQSKNIKPFFTASYSDSGIKLYKKDFNNKYHFVFVGSLSPGKRPLFAVRIIHSLKKMGFNVYLDIYGNGDLFEEIKEYNQKNGLERTIMLHGNKDQATIKAAYLNSHFSILPSKSEGWPKALAEAMYFGCVPIGTAVSCVPWMLDNGNRGIIIKPELNCATEKIAGFLKAPEELNKKSQLAQEWSQKYTLEKFNLEIKKLL